MEGCAVMPLNKEDQTGGDLKQGERLLAGGDYRGALKAYRKVLDRNLQPGSPAKPGTDQALFYIGAIYAAPKNSERDYQKALDSFQKLIREFPQSRYRSEAERSVLLLREIMSREKRLKMLKKQIDSLEDQIEKMKEIDLDIEEKRRNILNETRTGPAK